MFEIIIYNFNILRIVAIINTLSENLRKIRAVLNVQALQNKSRIVKETILDLF